MRVSTGPGQTALTRIALARDLAGGGLGQPDHGVLRGDIGRHAGGRDEPGDRGGVDDRAGFLLQHDSGSTCRSPRNTPLTLTPITWSNIASSYSAVCFHSPSMPALLKKQSIRP